MDRVRGVGKCRVLEQNFRTEFSFSGLNHREQMVGEPGRCLDRRMGRKGLEGE